MNKTFQQVTRVMISVLATVGAGIVTTLLFIVPSLGGQVSAQTAQNQAQTAQIRALTAQEQALAAQNRALQGEYSSLSSQVSGLNQPSDPLSAYNDICQAPLQNQGTGVTQTYYYPCTNVAQTTPEPGD